MRIKELIILGLVIVSCNSQAQKKQNLVKMDTKKTNTSIEYITFGNGCFWCTEVIFDQLEGIVSVESGYSGGHVKNPTYKKVTTGNTGHAEVIHIGFDAKIIDFSTLLDVFFNTHDPTTLNRQGADVGTQYRSAVFFHNVKQQSTANKMIDALNEANVFENKIVTEVTKFSNYYPAEDYHQNYFVNNRNQGYCRVVINPKLEKFLKQYKDKLKKE